MKVKIRLVNSIVIAILVCKLLSPERGQLSGLTFSVFLKASGPLAWLKKKKKCYKRASGRSLVSGC